MERSHLLQNLVVQSFLQGPHQKNMDYSLTYVGVIVTVIASVAAWLGISLGTAELTTTVITVLQLAGALVAFYGRWRQGDVNVVGIKK